MSGKKKGRWGRGWVGKRREDMGEDGWETEGKVCERMGRKEKGRCGKGWVVEEREGVGENGWEKEGKV